jgi:geranylgeranyl pyrophosphate synthase
MLEKKASVLEAHTRIGALVGNGKKNQIESLTQYGRILGTLIILRDEFIDLFEPQELSDRMKNGCLPLPMIYAFKNPEVRKGVMKILSKPKISRNDAETIVDFVFQDQKVKCLRNEMEDLSKKASKLTAGLCQQQNLHLLVTALLENLARV